jgi:hypothetical protein
MALLFRLGWPLGVNTFMKRHALSVHAGTGIAQNLPGKHEMNILQFQKLVTPASRK